MSTEIKTLDGWCEFSDRTSYGNGVGDLIVIQYP